jgi:hypothetical protein
VKLEIELLIAGPRSRCEDIKINLKELRRESTALIHLAYERRRSCGTVINIWVPEKSA